MPASVVMIGDSHSDYYGNKRGSFGFLGQRLNELMPDMQMYAVSGSSPEKWVKGGNAPYGSTAYVNGKSSSIGRIPTISSLPNADTLLVQQGTNMIGMSADQIRNSVQDTLSAAKGKYSNVLWVGPPPSAKNPKGAQFVDSILKSSLPDGQYYSSMGIPNPSFMKDGEHLAGTDTPNAWATGVADTLKKKIASNQ